MIKMLEFVTLLYVRLRVFWIRVLWKWPDLPNAIKTTRELHWSATNAPEEEYL